MVILSSSESHKGKFIYIRVSKLNKKKYLKVINLYHRKE